MSKQTTGQTARRSYIAILSAAASKLPGKVNDETVLMGELIEAELLTGGVGRGSEGTVIAFQDTGITVEGRLFLQRLQKEEREERLLNKALKYAPLVIGYLAGLLSPLMTEWLKKFIQ